MDISSIMLLWVIVVPAKAVFPGYFSYPAANQLFPVQPVFAYSVYTPGASVTSGPAPMARSIYTEPDNTYHGYSFETQYESGGRSNVVFVTGPQASDLLQKSIQLFRTSVSPELEKLAGSPENSNHTKNATVVETSSSASAKSNNPIASHYHFQIYPASTSPLIAPFMPFQNLIPSFAYTITNEIAASDKDTSENAGEAQESIIHEVGTAVVSEPSELLSNTSKDKSHNSPKSHIQSTHQTRTETSANNTTEATTTNTSTTSESSSENSSTKPNSLEKSNDLDESNTTTPGSDEIMETTSA